MGGFDAELYLRLEGERALVAGLDWWRMHESSPLTAAGQALVAAGIVDEAVVQAVLDDYDLAAALRGGEHGLMYAAFNETVEHKPLTEPLTPRRVVLCSGAVELAAGTFELRYVRFGEETTDVSGLLTTSTPRTRRGGPLFSPPSAVTLTDDRGTSRQAGFEGGGSETLWEGSFRARPGLHAETAYVELDGVRIELRDASSRAEARIEDLPAMAPALRHLWACVLPSDHGQRPPLEPAIDALVAAGALSPREPALAEIRAVAEAMGSGRPRARRSRRALPEPWRSLNARAGRSGGPEGSVAVGVATPVFDGYSVAVHALISGEHTWQIEADAAPADAVFSAYDSGVARPRQLVWWAADDRGNHYLGEIGSSSGDDEIAELEVHFGAPLDRSATYVDLLPTAATQRAVIRVPLEWGST